MIDKERIRGYLHEILNGTEFFPVDLRVDSSNRIIVHVDKPEGISIEDCVQISRALGQKLDLEGENFSLEVSSPGLDAPFRVPEQYTRSIGEMVSVQCRDGKKYLGILREADHDGINIEISSGEKHGKDLRKQLDFSQIASTKRHIKF